MPPQKAHLNQLQRENVSSECVELDLRHNENSTSLCKVEMESEGENDYNEILEGSPSSTFEFISVDNVKTENFNFQSDRLMAEGTSYRTGITDLSITVSSFSGFHTPDINEAQKAADKERKERLEELLQEVKSHISPLLPNRWIAIINDGNITVGTVAFHDAFIIQRSVCAKPSGNVQIFVHGKPLPASHKVWESVRTVALCPETSTDFSENILSVVNSVRSHEICRGIEDFQSHWRQAPNTVIDENDFKELRYVKTLRPADCLFLVPSMNTKRCTACKSLCGILAARSRRKESTPSVASHFKANKYLTTAETNEKLNNNRKMIESLRKANKRLQEKLAKYIKGDGEE